MATIENPKVTVIMATYNRANFITESINSILQQSFEDWECLIIDDGSTDNTKAVLQPYLKKDSRIKYFNRGSNHKKGLPGCRNFGLKLARGEFVVFFDDDDIVHPDNLKLCVTYFQKVNVDFCRYNREVFVGNFTYDFDRNSDISFFYIDEKDIERIVNGSLALNSCTVMWKMKCFNRGTFCEELMYAEEWELYPRLISSGLRGISLNKTLFYGRKHVNSNTGQFWNHDPVRRASKLSAIRLVINNLEEKNLLTPSLVKHFISLAFSLKEPKVIEYVLKKSDANWLKRTKFALHYRLLPTYRILQRRLLRRKLF